MPVMLVLEALAEGVAVMAVLIPRAEVAVLEAVEAADGTRTRSGLSASAVVAAGSGLEEPVGLAAAEAARQTF